MQNESDENKLNLAERTALTMKEVAIAAGVCPRTVAQWHKDGILKGRRIGQVLRFDLDEVKALFRPIGAPKA